MKVLQMSLSVSVFILAIIIIRAFTIHRLPKKTFLALWGIALCKLLIPFSIPSRFSIYNVSMDLKEMFGEFNGSINLPNGGIISNTTAISSELPVAEILNSPLTHTPDITPWPVPLIWLIGLVICILLILVTHLCRISDYRTALPIENEFINRWLKGHSIKRTIQIRQSDKIVAPLTYGVWKPVILLPKTLDLSNETMVNYVLTHEFVHIKRFDILYKWVLAAALCIHWFNPLVWAMYILSNRDLEISCDEQVVRTLGEINKSSYALMLIEFEEKKSRLLPLLAGFSKNIIEERIVAIMKIKKTTIISLLIALALVAGSTIVFATSAKDKKDLGMFEKAFGDDAYKYIRNINKVSDETAGIRTQEYGLYIDSTVFTDHNVYAIVGADGNLPEDFSINGKIVFANHVQDLYRLKGEVCEMESVNGVRYFLYSAIITDLETEQSKDIDPMLILAAGDSFYKRSSLRDLEGENLELGIELNNREHILTTAVQNVSTNALVFYPDTNPSKGDYYSKVILTPWEVKFSGHSDKSYAGYEELDKELYIDMTIVLSGRKKINMSYDSRKTVHDEGYTLGMSRGANMDTGDFYHWWNFHGWELDLSQVHSITLDNKTYRPFK